MTAPIIFLDTEFTNFDTPELISIGLAASNGNEFYAEVEYSYASCTQFVRDTVVPLLMGSAKLSRRDLRVQLLEWLMQTTNSEPAVICFDSDYDRIIIQDIFEKHQPGFLIYRRLGHQHINTCRRQEFYTINSAWKHHSLHDAQALRHAFRGWVRNVR